LDNKEFAMKCWSLFKCIITTTFLVAAMAAFVEVGSAQSLKDRLKKAVEDAKNPQQQQQQQQKNPGQPSQQPKPATSDTNAPATSSQATSKPQPSGALATLPGSPAKIDSVLLVNGEPGLRFALSSHGGHLAAVTSKGSRVVMTEDGVEGPRFDEILPVDGASGAGWVHFNSDGSHYGYVGRSGQEYVVMMDQTEVGRGPISNGVIKAFGFTPGGKHLYYVTFVNDSSRTHSHLVVDGKAGPESNEIIQPLFSPDGEHHAYVLQIYPLSGQRSWALIVDGKRAAYQASPIGFTGDSAHLFTQVQNAGTVSELVDGKEFMKAQNVRLFLAPVGNAFVAVVRQGIPTQGGGDFVVIGTQKVMGSDCTGTAGISKVVWSEDGKHWAALCQATNNSWWVMADGKKGLDYQTVSDVAFNSEGKPVYVAANGTKRYMVVGDKESAGYATIIQPLFNGAFAPGVIRGKQVGFIGSTISGSADLSVVVGDNKPIVHKNAAALMLSPDGSRFAFTSTEGGVNVDGVDDGTAVADYQYLPEDSARFGGPVGKLLFSPDSKHIFHFGRLTTADTFGVVIDGKFFPVGRGIPSVPTFTPDSKHIFWVDREEGNSSVVYLDGKPATRIQFNQSQIGGWWDMGADGVLTVITQDGDAMKRLRITPPEDSSVDTLVAAAKPLPKK
jgi:hypothetical protein